MKALIAGFGEVGRGVYEAFKDYHDIDWIDVDVSNTTQDQYEILIIFFGYTDNFVESVKKYQDTFKPTATLIFSTVPIGTTRQIENAVHCPIEGKHPDLKDSIRLFERFIGGINTTAIMFFMQAGIQTYSYDEPETTEICKLLSTTNYGINIEYARFSKELCDQYSVNYESVKFYNRAYNRLYSSMIIDNPYQRYILDPPKGNIGGHCILQNLPLLKKSINNDFIKILEDNNV